MMVSGRGGVYIGFKTWGSFNFGAPVFKMSLPEASLLVWKLCKSVVKTASRAGTA